MSLENINLIEINLEKTNCRHKLIFISYSDISFVILFIVK